jgi:hypothetical protein
VFLAEHCALLSAAGKRSVDLHTAAELLVLVVDEPNRLLVDENALVDAHGERLRVGLRVLDRHVDLQLSESRPPEALGELHLLAVRAAAHVEPPVVRSIFSTAEIVRLDDQRVAFPAADRIAVPPRFRPIGGSARPSVAKSRSGTRGIVTRIATRVLGRCSKADS